MDFTIHGGSNTAHITLENERNIDGILFVDVKLTTQTPEIPTTFSVVFHFPATESYSVWSPSLRYERALNPNWWKRPTASRLTSWMPLHTLVSPAGKNRLTIALSDAKNPTAIETGIREEDALWEAEIKFFTGKVAPLTSYCATIRLDMRAIPYYDSIYDVVKWWETVVGPAAPVPETARLPMNSLWYSYHQELDVEDILQECALSKPLGMDTVIIDDGWETDDTHRGFAYCGDWEVSAAKIPDMKDFVDRIHSLGMKVMLWYSVPFVGIHSKNYARFRDILLDVDGEGHTTFCLDPRYPEAREFLMGVYTKAVTDWGLDGLKLDFIDSFSLTGKSLEYDARRDFQSLEDAVDHLMTQIIHTLRALNPDIMIEFRQSYVGPAIRKYGNMMRVSDCPADAMRNRVDTVNLRLTSGNTAVHSDMLMWHPEDTVESAAMQIVSALYSVPQISMKIKTLNDSHKKMLAYYLAFWRNNRETLLDGKILAANPESCYSQVCAEKDGKAIFTAYTNPVIDCAAYNEIIAVNATAHNTIVLKGAAKKIYRVVNCMGEELTHGIVQEVFAEISVPLSGMVFVS